MPVTLCGAVFHRLRLTLCVPRRGPATPRYKYRGLGCSRFARRYSGNRCALSFPPVTEMFHFTGFGSYGPIEFRPLYSDITRSGFSHSDIHGSKRECRSPWLIATYYVLHRLSSPRHPPCALSSLITNLPSGSLSSSRLTYILSIIVVFTHYNHCMQLSKNCRRFNATGKIFVKGTGGRGRIRTSDPALIKRML